MPTPFLKNGAYDFFLTLAVFKIFLCWSICSLFTGKPPSSRGGDLGGQAPTGWLTGSAPRSPSSLLCPSPLCRREFLLSWKLPASRARPSCGWRSARPGSLFYSLVRWRCSLCPPAVGTGLRCQGGRPRLAGGSRLGSVTIDLPEQSFLPLVGNGPAFQSGAEASIRVLRMKTISGESQACPSVTSNH